MWRSTVRQSLHTPTCPARQHLRIDRETPFGRAQVSDSFPKGCSGRPQQHIARLTHSARGRDRESQASIRGRLPPACLGDAGLDTAQDGWSDSALHDSGKLPQLEPASSQTQAIYAEPAREESLDSPTVGPSSQAEAARRWFYAFFKFSRPHTVLGSFISVVSVSLLALGPHEIGWRSLGGLLQALIPALLMNIHIVGLNQIFDIEIDKVNKPYLPLASGEFSLQTAWTIVSACGASALLMGVAVGSLPLLATLVGSAVLGLAYSVDLPLLRWKLNPIASAACILAVRAVLVQLGFFFHMRQVLGHTELTLTPPLGFTIAFMLFFSVVIALFKDIPDVKGDQRAGVRTFSVRRGTSTMFWTCICLLELAYAGAVVAGLASRVLWSRLATVAAHAGMGVLLYLRARKTDLQQSKSIYGCYMFVWKLFYAEYLFIPLLR